MNIKFTKKEKFLVIFYLFMIVVLGLGISFSYFLLADSAKKDSTQVYAGRLDIKYTQGDKIITDKLYPISEPDFYTNESIYKTKFSVTTEGTLEQTVQIGFNITINQFSKDMIRYALYSSTGNKLSTGYLNEGFVVLMDNLYFQPIENRDFVLLIWLEEKQFLQTEQGNKLSGNIIINSKQFGY